MLCSTKGIVFHSLKYSETSIIVKIYTELFGIQSYLIRGMRKTRSKIKPALFQPLTLLDLEVYHREQASLQSIRGVHLAVPYQTIPFDIRKSSVALFINELLYKSIREEEPNPNLFGFLWNTCIALDSTDENVSDFHIRFAIQLMHYLGIFPQLNYSLETNLFNMREGIFQSGAPMYPECLDAKLSIKFFALLESNLSLSDLTPGPSPKEEDPTPGPSPKREGGMIVASERRELLEKILQYYQLHLPGFTGIKSHGILQEALS
ncbi:MAG: DNA repair protein RecO [Bacteroidetes bacterium]|nr:DNA repair protein RecO [Bacteroidota bacterium]